MNLSYLQLISVDDNFFGDCRGDATVGAALCVRSHVDETQDNSVGGTA